MDDVTRPNASVLVIDDEPCLRTVMSEFLKDAGHRVEVAEDGIAAQEMLRNGDYGVVVSDIILPGLSGVALLHAIREQAPDVQVIMMTGEPTADTAIEAFRAGAFEYLSKPVSKEEITKAVANATKLRNSERERLRLLAENRQYQENLERLVNERTAELHKSQEQLRQAQKMEAIGKLAGGVAHDFNNLLMVIGNAAEFLDEEDGMSDTARRDIHEIFAAAERASNLTRQLLAFSRKQELRRERLDVRGIIDGVTRMLGRLLGEDIDIRVEATETACVGNVDPGQIEQVLMNLAVNARDAMPKGGDLLLEVGRTALSTDDLSGYLEAEAMRPGPYVVLSVTDTGFGMDAEMRSRVFDPFFTTKGEGDGTGLGLSTVYGIVKQHGGHITVYSEVGNGTTFRIYLPESQAGVDGLPGESETPVPQGNGETILLAEDDESVARITARLLRSLDYTVLTANGADAAMGLLREHLDEVRVLLTDVVMPGVDGPDLAKRVLAVRPDVKVVYASGYPAGHLARRGMRDGQTVLLRKPFVKHELADTLHDALAE